MVYAAVPVALVAPAGPVSLVAPVGQAVLDVLAAAPDLAAAPVVELACYLAHLHWRNRMMIARGLLPDLHQIQAQS